MIVCPRCGYPQPEKFIISNEDQICKRCDWKGPVQDLIYLPDSDPRFHDPRKLDRLLVFLQKEVSKSVGEELVRLGFVNPSSKIDKEELRYFANVLKEYTRAGYTALLRCLVEGGQGG